MTQSKRSSRKPPAHWLDPRWRYENAASHVDSTAFRQRQQERLVQVQGARKAA
jgi:hypothetical protein